ncbi:MAG: CPBP family intramembrane glutamic endopeptidase, partial [Mobilitalea sp.]
YNTIDKTQISLMLASTASFPVSIVIFAGWYRRLNQMETKIIREKNFIIKSIGLITLLALSKKLFDWGFLNLTLYRFEKIIMEHNKLIDQILERNPIIVMLEVIILAPITEELIFRGVILKKARGIMPFFVANIVQAALFALVHMNLVQAVYTFGGGLLTGYVAYKYKSILPSILLHMLSNLLGSIGLPFQATYINLITIMIVGALLTFILVKKISSVDINIDKEPKFQNSYEIEGK